MNNENLVRTSCVVFLIAAGIFFLVAAKSILVPMVIGLFIAFLLLPLCRKMEKKKFPRSLSALISITLIGVTITALLWFMSSQFLSFREELPMMSEKLNMRIADLQEYVTANFGISEQEQLKWMEEQLVSLMSSGGQFAADIFSATGNFIAAAALVPIYAFFFIYYRGKIRDFVKMVTPKTKHEKALSILQTTSTVSYKYLLGLTIDIAILSVLNSLGFYLLGINHAVFLGITAGLLNVIPYVGVLIGSVVPVILALITKDTIWVAVGALAVCVAVQFLDNNFITPMVIGSAVSVNPLATMVALLFGGLIWGLAGMMLFIPMLGVLKVFCDRIDPLKPFGYLIGEQERPGTFGSRRKTNEQPNA